MYEKQLFGKIGFKLPKQSKKSNQSRMVNEFQNWSYYAIFYYIYECYLTIAKDQ